jgi:hypothetical protein
MAAGISPGRGGVALLRGGGASVHGDEAWALQEGWWHRSAGGDAWGSQLQAARGDAGA